MPYEIVCDTGDFRKVEHRIDEAEERKESHEEETNHSVVIREFRMNA